MKYLIKICLLLLVMALFPCHQAKSATWSYPTSTPSSPFAGGGGTSREDPYIIKTAQQLANLAYLINTGNSAYTNNYYRLDADIDLGSQSWTPIGNTSSRPFTNCEFNGNGHTISGLYIYSPSSANAVGLFGYTGGTQEYSQIWNLTVKGSVTGKDDVGAIAGHAVQTGLYGCNNVGCTVKGTKNVGGIVGYYNSGSYFIVANNASSVSGTSYVGGICGQSVAGTIHYCLNRGSVTGSSNVGSIAGYNNGSIITTYYLSGSAANAVGSSGSNALGTPQSCSNTQLQSGEITYTLYNNDWGRSFWGQRIGTDSYPVMLGYYPNYIPSSSSYIVKQIYSHGSSTQGYGNGNGHTVAASTSNHKHDDSYNVTYTWSSDNSACTATEVCKECGMTKTQSCSVTSTTVAGTCSSPGSTTYTAKVTTEGGRSLSATKTVTGTTGSHSFDSNGFCTKCTTGYQPATKVGSYYEINNAGKLYWFAAQVNDNINRSIMGKLTANIRVNSNVLNSSGSLNGTGTSFRVWTPIGSSAYSFNGSFLGQGYTISGLYINDTSKNLVGLFGNCLTATIQSVTLKDSYFKGGNYVGGIAGCCDDCQMSDCFNYGTMMGSTYVGGVVGDYSGKQHYGANCLLENCINWGKVQGTKYVGGICGSIYAYNETITIGTCANFAAIGTSTSTYTGGIVGQMLSNFFNSNVKSSFNAGTISGNSSVGSIVGYRNEGYIGHCVAKVGTSSYIVSGQSNGYQNAFVSDFSTGEACYILNERVDAGTKWYQTLGSDAYPVLDRTHGVVYSYEVFGEKRYINTPYAASWTYPTSIPANPFSGGTGTSRENPYIIKTAQQLANLAYLINTGNPSYVETSTNTNHYYRLDADIDLEGLPWTPIGNTSSSPFCNCEFNGNGHTIKGLYVNSGDTDNAVGLFGYTGGINSLQYCQIWNLTVKGTVTGKNDVGAIAGHSERTGLYGCSNADCTVTGSQNVGGVVGWFDGGPYYLVANNTGLVSGTSYVGGIGGYIKSGPISSSFNRGSVTGSSSVGSIAGYNNSSISTTYYLSGSATNALGATGANSSGTPKPCTTSECQTGEIAYNLYNNVWGRSFWGQRIGTDNYPVMLAYYPSEIPSSSEYLISKYYLHGSSSAKYGNGISGHTVAASVSNHKHDDSYAVTYTWSSDYSACTAKEVCEVCNAQVSQTCDVTSNSTASTCSVPGSITYTATVTTAGGRILTTTETKSGSKSPHSFDSNGFCSNCDAGYQPAVLAGSLYEISNAGNLYWFASQVNSGINRGIKGKLTADIQINENVLAANGSLNGTGAGFRVWTPIGSAQYPFSGSLSGQGHTISGLYVNDQTNNYVGLFGRCLTATIQSVIIKDSYFKGTYYVGGIAGSCDDCQVSECENYGTATGVSFVGGIAGYFYGSQNYGDNCLMEACVNHGCIDASSYVGGVCGSIYADTENIYISSCANMGTIGNATTSSVGGIIGEMDCDDYDCHVSSCFNSGLILGSSYVGSLVGDKCGCFITNCVGKAGTANCLVDGSTYNITDCQFLSDLTTGEAAYLLNGKVNAGTTWYQNLDNGEAADEYPVLDSTHGLVYKIGSYYSNFEKPRWCGDLDVDGDCDEDDITLLIDVITGKHLAPDNISIADFIYDEQITVADLVYLIDVVNGNRENVPVKYASSGH